MVGPIGHDVQVPFLDSRRARQPRRSADDVEAAVEPGHADVVTLVIVGVTQRQPEDEIAPGDLEQAAQLGARIARHPDFLVGHQAVGFQRRQFHSLRYLLNAQARHRRKACPGRTGQIGLARVRDQTDPPIVLAAMRDCPRRHEPKGVTEDQRVPPVSLPWIALPTLDDEIGAVGRAAPHQLPFQEGRVDGVGFRCVQRLAAGERDLPLRLTVLVAQ